MKSHRTMLRILSLTVALGVALAIFPWAGVIEGDFGSALAQNSRRDEQKAKKKTRRVPTLSEKVAKKLIEAQELMENDQFAEAHQVLMVASGMRRLKAYDQAIIHQMLGYNYSTQENYRGAIQEFEQLLIVGSDVVPEGMLTSTVYNLGQMYMVIEEWAKGIEMLKRWFTLVDNPGPDPHFLMAQGYYQVSQFRDGIPFVVKAIDLTNAQGRQARENWYQLLLAMHFEVSDYRGMVGVLEVLVDLYPKKNYWFQLSSMYGELKEEKKQLGVMEVAYNQGYFERSREFVNLAQLCLYHEIPYKAAKILETGLKDESIEPTKDNWELLANALVNAAEYERAIPYLAKAAGMASDGELYVRLGQAHMQNEDWGKAVEAFDNAVKKGKLKRKGTAYLLVGMANFHAENFRAARTAFREARKDKSVAKVANQWLRYLEREQRQRAQQ